MSIAPNAAGLARRGTNELFGFCALGGPALTTAVVALMVECRIPKGDSIISIFKYAQTIADEAIEAGSEAGAFAIISQAVRELGRNDQSGDTESFLTALGRNLDIFQKGQSNSQTMANAQRAREALARLRSSASASSKKN